MHACDRRTSFKDGYIDIAGRNTNSTCDLNVRLVSISELHTAPVDSQVGSGVIGSDQVGSGRVWSCRVKSGRVSFFLKRSPDRFESGPVVCKYYLFCEAICVNYGGSDRVWSDQNICY